jgi:hypothetical protein
MRAVIDILTPKQCMLFSKLSENLEGRGHQMFKTTRRYREVNQLLSLKKVDAIVVGEHGGGTLSEKLKASARRILELAAVFEDIKPDVAVSFSSPEMARAAYGLKVPHVCVNDSPHAEAVARLTVPLSEELLTPMVIPKSAWTRFGIGREKIVKYNALDPWAWLRGFEPDEKIVEELGLDASKPVVTFRPEETFAAYLLGKTRNETSVVPIIDGLLDARHDLQIVAVPRYDEQVRSLKDVFENRITVAKSVVDGPSLLHRSAVFIGAGGTMSAEAALLGVPTFSCYPGESFLVERYLIRKKLVVRETDPKKIVAMILNILDNYDHEKRMWRKRALKVVSTYEDPIKVIAEEVEKYR